MSNTDAADNNRDFRKDVQKMNEPRQRIVISIAEYLKKIWYWIPVIISWSLLCAMLAAAVKIVLKEPVFRADTSIYILDRIVQSDYERYDMSDIQVSTQMTNDGIDILKSEQMAEKVIANLKNDHELRLNMTTAELLKMVDITREDDSLLVTISVRSPDPYIACDLANIYRETAVAELEERIMAKGIQTVEEAIIPVMPSGRSSLVYALLGAIAGAFAASVILFVHYVKNDARREPEDIQEV